MKRFILLICVLALPVATSAQENFDNEYGKLYEAQKLTSSQRWNLGLNYGVDLSSSYYTSHILDGSIGFKITNSFSLGLSGAKFFNTSTPFKKDFEAALNRQLYQMEVKEPLFNYTLYAEYIPLMGLVNVFSRFVVELSLFGRLGVGQILYTDIRLFLMSYTVGINAHWARHFGLSTGYKLSHIGLGTRNRNQFSNLIFAGITFSF